MRRTGDYYGVGGDGWWYCIACRKRTSEALMDDDWFETSSYVLCPDCTVKACRAYANTLAPSSLPTITTTPDAQT